MSKNYISVEHAIRNIMMVEDWKQNLTPEQRKEYASKYGTNTARWPRHQPQNASQVSQTTSPGGQSDQQKSFLGTAADAAAAAADAATAIGKEMLKGVQPSKWLDQAADSLRTNNLRTSKEPPPGTDNSVTTSNTTNNQSSTNSNNVSVGYGDGKVDPRLASAAGIGPKLAGSEPTASKPSTSAETPEKQKSTPNIERKSKTPPVPNITLASKLSDLNYKSGMGAAARSEYLQKSGDAAWKKPTRQNLSLRQRAEREQYGPSNR